MMQREMRLKWRHLLSCFSPVRSGSARNAKRMRESTCPGTGENKNGSLKMKKHRHRILGAVIFVLYLVLLTYFLFFAEEMGRSPDARAEYSYNLTLFKEIRRFILYRDILGWRAVFLNIFGNVLAFMPFGFFLPVIWERTRHWYITVILSFAMSLTVETMQLVGKVGSFDVDDLLLNTIGGFVGYIIFALAKGVWERYSGTNRK